MQLNESIGQGYPYTRGAHDGTESEDRHAEAAPEVRKEPKVHHKKVNADGLEWKLRRQRDNCPRGPT